MVVRISPLRRSPRFPRSARGVVSYLEKENRGAFGRQVNFFFDQHQDRILPAEVLSGIDGNTAKLHRTEPRYHSVIISPSERELLHIRNDQRKLRAFTRAVMTHYAASFNREIDGRPVVLQDIRYYAKIEHFRSYKKRDHKVKMNAPYLEKIKHLENELKEIKDGDFNGEPSEIRQKIEVLRSRAPHRINGKLIQEGMQKEGLQTHIHVLVSRRDTTNSYTLSPATPFRSQEFLLNGKLIRRGFDRDRFYQAAEKAFDQMFNYNRSFGESYRDRKTFLKDPKQYYYQLQQLSTPEKKAAMELLRREDLSQLPAPSIRFAIKQIRKLMSTLDRSSSISY